MTVMNLAMGTLEQPRAAWMEDLDLAWGSNSPIRSAFL